jgi:hypothetical protein
MLEYARISSTRQVHSSSSYARSPSRISVPKSPAKGQDLSRSPSKLSLSRSPSSKSDFLSSSPSFRKDASRSPSWPSFSRSLLFGQQDRTNLSRLSLARNPLPRNLMRKNPSPKIALSRSSFRRPRLSTARTTSRKQAFEKISSPRSSKLSFSSSSYFDRIYFAASRNHSFRLYLTQGSYLKPAFSMSPSHRKSLDRSPSATRRPFRKPKFKVLAGLALGTVNMDPCHSNTFSTVSLRHIAGKLPMERAHSVKVEVSRRPVPQQVLDRITVPRSPSSTLTFIQSPSHPLSSSMSFLLGCIDGSPHDSLTCTSQKIVNSKIPSKYLAYSSSPCVTQKSSPSPAVAHSRSPRRLVISRRFPFRLSRRRRPCSRARNRRTRLQLARSRGFSGLDLKKRSQAHTFTHNASSASLPTVVPDHVAFVSESPVGQSGDGARRKAWHSCFLYYLLVLAMTRAAAATGKGNNNSYLQKRFNSEQLSSNPFDEVMNILFLFGNRIAISIIIFANRLQTIDE